MNNFDKNAHKSAFFKGICLLVAWLLVLGPIFPHAGYAQTPAVLPQASSLTMPAAGTRVSPSQPYTPVLIKGIQIDPINPFNLDFIIDTGDTRLDDQALREEAERLVRYFLTSLTIPEDEFWVNLSPFEKDKIITDNFSKTEMGRDLLAQDYLLKQLTASLIYPENELGKDFWSRVYKKAYEQYGTTNIPTDTFNKVWIMPKTAKIYQTGAKVFIAESTLEVLLEEDYLAKTKSKGIVTGHKQSEIASQIVREIIVPEIEKEVNEGKNFAPLRQIYHSVILATWFKKNLKGHLINQSYSQQSKINGIDSVDKMAKNEIYNQYLSAYKQGAYNFIRVEKDDFTKKNIPRKYFAGGIVLNNEPISSPQKVKKNNLKKFTDKIIGSPKLIRVKLKNLWRNSQLNKKINDQKYYREELTKMDNLPKPMADKMTEMLKTLNEKFSPTTFSVYTQNKYGPIKNIRKRPSRLNLVIHFKDTNGFKPRSLDVSQTQYERNLALHVRYLLMSLEDFVAPRTKMRTDIRKLVHPLESPFIIRVVGVYCESTKTLKPFYGVDEFLGQTTHKFFEIEKTDYSLERREVLERSELHKLSREMLYVDDTLYFGDIHQTENKMGLLGAGTATNVYKTPYRFLAARIKFGSDQFKNERMKNFALRTEAQNFRKLSKFGISPNAYLWGEVNDYNFLFVDRIIGTSLDKKHDDLKIERRGLRYNKIKMIGDLLRKLLKNGIVIRDLKPSNIMIGRFYGVNHIQAFVEDVMTAIESKRGVGHLAQIYKEQFEQKKENYRKLVKEFPKENWKVYDPNGYLIEFLDYVIKNDEIPDSEWANTLAGEENADQGIFIKSQEPETKNSSSSAKKLGGIDLTANNINLEVEGSSLDLNFINSSYQIYADDITGLYPVTINIAPISNFEQFFNLN